MKMIHTADIHLGSKMDSRFPKEIAESRRKELRNTFCRMVNYARENGVEVILLVGDVFDCDVPYRKDKDFFYSVVRNNPRIDFLYLRGNHDIGGEDSGESLPNLKRFSDRWTSYAYGDVVVTGVEMNGENATSIYSTLTLAKDKKNIVLLHGQIDNRSGKDLVNLKKLSGKNIGYLALGHVHKPQSGALDGNAEYVYCGCLEGRGFDETGTRGFELLDIGEKIAHTFVPFAERTVCECDVDIGGARDAYQAVLTVKQSVKFDGKNLYRVNLTGEISYEIGNLCSDVEKYLADCCYYVEVKDRTSRKIDLSAFAKDTSLKGEFVRCVCADRTLSEEMKIAVIDCGLKALKGEEADL